MFRMGTAGVYVLVATVLHMTLTKGVCAQGEEAPLKGSEYCPMLYATYLVAFNGTYASDAQTSMLCMWAESIRLTSSSEDSLVLVTDRTTSFNISCEDHGIVVFVADVDKRMVMLSRLIAYQQLLNNELADGKCVVAMDNDMLLLKSVQPFFQHHPGFDMGLTWRTRFTGSGNFMPVNNGIFLLPPGSDKRRWILRIHANWGDSGPSTREGGTR
eukprot:6991603-Pyramimonas_sp.AAC.1